MIGGPPRHKAGGLAEESEVIVIVFAAEIQDVAGVEDLWTGDGEAVGGGGGGKNGPISIDLAKDIALVLEGSGQDFSQQQRIAVGIIIIVIIIVIITIIITSVVAIAVNVVVLLVVVAVDVVDAAITTIIIIIIIIIITRCAVHRKESDSPVGCEARLLVIVVEIPNGPLGRIIGDARHLQKQWL